MDALEKWAFVSSVADPIDLTGFLSGCTALEVADFLKDWVLPGANLSEFFANSTALRTVDIHKLDMTDQIVVDMFAGCSSLGDAAKGGFIRLGRYTKLTDTGISSAPNRTTRDGMWVRYGENPIGWFGSGNQLIQLYPDGVSGLGNQITDPEFLDYSWDNTRLGGRFDSNPNAWWMFFINDTRYEGEDMKAGTLLLGADRTATNKEVTETFAGRSVYA